ncbi:hypothetical protein ABZ814_11080 [Micromonospora musae]|uniref:hypothetical protein n=1 Tax=Micromonospora musae TaxID=1894970 RepID=UPI0033DFB2A9
MAFGLRGPEFAPVQLAESSGRHGIPPACTSSVDCRANHCLPDVCYRAAALLPKAHHGGTCGEMLGEPIFPSRGADPFVGRGRSGMLLRLGEALGHVNPSTRIDRANHLGGRPLKVLPVLEVIQLLVADRHNHRDAAASAASHALQ